MVLFPSTHTQPSPPVPEMTPGQGSDERSSWRKYWQISLLPASQPSLSPSQAGGQPLSPHPLQAPVLVQWFSFLPQALGDSSCPFGGVSTPTGTCFKILL